MPKSPRQLTNGRQAATAALDASTNSPGSAGASSSSAGSGAGALAFGLGASTAGLGAAGAAPFSGQGQEFCADADFVAGFDINPGDGSGRGGRNGGDGFFVFELEDGLVFRDLIAFFDEQIDHCSRVGALAEMWKFLNP